jgi:MATE family multidrug resistance protein
VSSASPARARGELAAQLALAVPRAGQQVGLQLMGAVDTALLGRYHADALAGAGVANGVVFGISCIGMGIVMGLDTLVPQALGAGDRAGARRLLLDGLRVAMLVGLPLTLLALLVPLLLAPIGVEPSVAYEAKIYAWARAFGIAPFILQVALRSFLSAAGVTRPLIIAVVAGNLLNAVADWVFVFGDRGLAEVGLPTIGLPAMGVIGAALATSLVQILTLGLYAIAVRSMLADAPPPSPERTTRRIVTLGVPVGLQLLAEVGVFALASVLAATMGRTPAAAHQVAITLASFTFSVAVGIGGAAAVRVGHAVGSGDHRGARAAGVASLMVGGVVMSISAACFVVLASPLARLFTDDAAVVAAAIPLIQIAAIFQLSDGAQAIGAGALRGAGDTRATFVANLVGHYAVGLGISLVCAFALGMGAPGLWWGLSAGLTGTAIVLIARFFALTSRPIARA